MADTTVDARNLQCPMPVVKTAMAINDITSPVAPPPLPVAMHRFRAAGPWE